MRDNQICYEAVALPVRREDGDEELLRIHWMVGSLWAKMADDEDDDGR